MKNPKPVPAEAQPTPPANPSSTPTSRPVPTNIEHRLVLPIQTRGNIGKSTEAIARCEWMTQRQVQWQGYDLDTFNRTLSTTFPDHASLVEDSGEPEGEIIKILRRAALSPVTVIDPRAHMNDTILKAMGMVDFTARAADNGVRATVLIFPIDEISDMDDIATTVGVLGAGVDWVLVKNRVKTPRTRMFDGSDLEHELESYGAARLELPALLSDTRNHLRAVELQEGRGISPAEALRNPDLKVDTTHRIILEDWLRTLFRGFEAIAGHLLPTAQAATIAASCAPAADRRSVRRGAKINRANIE